MVSIQQVKERYLKLVEEVKSFSKEVKIVVVTKYVDDVGLIAQLKDVGITDIAESYAQQMEKKCQKLKELNFPLETYRWHFVGHLQRNKVKKVVPIATLIQSLDSVELAQKINSVCGSLNKIQECLVELKVSEEQTKFGVEEKDIKSFVEELLKLKLENIKLVGLMAMAPYFDNPEHTRPYFKKAYKVFEEIKSSYKNELKDFNILSMGMSNDYKIALQEGANMIRIGSLLFGE